MATETYTAIASITLGSSASSVTFSSIPQDYRDLVLVVSGSRDTAGITIMDYVVNSFTSASYSIVQMDGTGTEAGTNSRTTDTALRIGLIADDVCVNVSQFMDYSATDKHKTVLTRANDGTSLVRANAARYPSTSAITSIDVSPASGNFTTGSTFALWGIAS